MIESTAYKPTSSQREADARKHIACKLARIGQECLVLGYAQAARCCEQAIEELKKVRTETKP